MPSYVTPKKNVEFIFYVSLRSQADPTTFKSAPTLLAGDFKVSTDGGALANLGTLPTVTPAAGDRVKITLSAAEMTGDNVHVVAQDAAGAEWCGDSWLIQTSARQIDDLAYPATSGRSMVVDAAGLVDANAVKVGPTGAGTAQTARDVGLSVLVGDKTGFALTAAYDPAKTAAQAGNAMDLIADAVDGVSLATAAVDEIVAAVWALASRSMPAAERLAVADALLARNIAGGSSAGRTVTSALRRLRNKVALDGAGIATVYQEDDATPDHTAAYTTAARNPLASVAGS